jgi:hypothetical protein
MDTRKDGDSILAPERDAQNILRGLGLEAEKVGTTSDKMADFRIDGDEPAAPNFVAGRELVVAIHERAHRNGYLWPFSLDEVQKEPCADR